MSLHKYLYTHADPLNGIDPTGMVSLAGVTIGMAIVGGLFGGLGGAIAGYQRGGLKGAVIGGITGSLVGVLVGGVLGVSIYGVSRLLAGRGNIFFEVGRRHRGSAVAFFAGAGIGAVMGTFFPELGLYGLIMAAAGLVPTTVLFRVNAMIRVGTLGPTLQAFLQEALGFFTNTHTGQPLSRYGFIRTTTQMLAYFLAGYALGYLAGVTTQYAVNKVLDAFENQ